MVRGECGLRVGKGTGPGGGPPGATTRQERAVNSESRGCCPLLGLNVRFIIPRYGSVTSNPVDADFDDPLKVIHRLSCLPGERFIGGRPPSTAEVAHHPGGVREEEGFVPLEGAPYNPGVNKPCKGTQSLRLAHIVICLPQGDGARVDGYPPLLNHKARPGRTRVPEGRAVRVPRQRRSWGSDSKVP